MDPASPPALDVAFACHEGRIAPVFDTARHLLLLTFRDGRIEARREEELPEEPSAARAERLAALRVGTIVCGAISRPLQETLEALGIVVMPFLAGEIPAVIAAWRAGRLPDEAFAMPGCRGRMRMRGKGFAPGRGARGNPAGGCVCPSCGQRAPHEPGIPCRVKRCPRCGAALERE